MTLHRILSTVFSARNCMTVGLIWAALVISAVASPVVFGDVM